MNNQKYKLILEDGTEFEGTSFGSNINTSGELVFYSGMVGYPELLTDPSLQGKILVLTYPLIGNSGVPKPILNEHNIITNFNSDKIQIQGLVVSNYSTSHSHYRSIQPLSNWLTQNNIPAIHGLDTRLLAKKIQKQGTMSAKIVNSSDKYDKNFPNPSTLPTEQINSTINLSANQPDDTITLGAGKTKLLLFDTGVNNSILSELLNLNTTIYKVPHNYNLENSTLEIDGIILPNGPGSPSSFRETITQIKTAIQNNIPIFAIHLGTLLLTLALGGKTYKLKSGHYSNGQPVLNLHTNISYLTTQNHDYGILEESLPNNTTVWFQNINDNSVEGIKHTTQNISGVLFNPEGNPGLNNTKHLFSNFINSLDKQ